MQNTSLLIQKSELTKCEARTVDMPPLSEASVRIAIDRFALTSNNITYAAFGDAMNYWKFFPATDANGLAEPAWGQIPVWGFGTVIESRHPEVAVGEHLYGYFPMAGFLDVQPAKVTPLSFHDAAVHRAELHPVYNQYTRTTTDGFYTADTEDLQALLRPLFITSWLIDDFLADNDYFGAAAQAKSQGIKPVMLLSSASSKTAYGTAFQMSQRDTIEVVGLTSAANVAFCEGLGCYDRVVTYEQITSLPASTPCVYVDFAGNGEFRKTLHAHMTGLAYSCSIGGTHVNELGGGRGLTGPKPVLFFAPAQIKKRSSEWGPQGLGQRLVAAWQSFLGAVQRPDSPWLSVQHHRGIAAAQTVYLQLLTGKSDARVGHMISL